MEVTNWLTTKETELKKQLNCISAELETIRTVKEYLYSNFFSNDAQELFLKYMINIEGYCNWKKVNIEGFNYDPDETFMRSIEEKIGISENAKKSFREEILIRSSSTSRKGQVFDYKSHERLKAAIEKCL